MHNLTPRLATVLTGLPGLPARKKGRREKGGEERERGRASASGGEGGAHVNFPNARERSDAASCVN